MIVIGSYTSDNGPSCFTEDVSHFLELRQNRQLALLKRFAKNCENITLVVCAMCVRDLTLAIVNMKVIAAGSCKQSQLQIWLVCLLLMTMIQSINDGFNESRCG